MVKACQPPVNPAANPVPCPDATTVTGPSSRTVTVERSTLSLSVASWDSSASRSPWRRLSSPSSWTTCPSAVARPISARTRSTLARIVRSRLSVSTYWEVTSSLLVLRSTTVPSWPSRSSVGSSLTLGTDRVISPTRSTADARALGSPPTGSATPDDPICSDTT